jgi:dihydroorotate dehydrogenase
MRLRGIDFGSVLDASGVRGFFGEGYWYHRWMPGLDFTGSTFVAKTTTLHPRAGNMPLKADGLSPRELRPKCIVVKPFQGVALNAVGLSGPGAAALLEDGRWQGRREPFFLSFMSVAATAEERHAEFRGFLDLLRPQLPRFKAPVGLQINFSCPNVGLHAEDLVREVKASLDAAAFVGFGMPLMPKFNALLSIAAALEIGRHPACAAICVSNTIPWGQYPELIDWKGIFGSEESPLKRFGGGGLSGRPLLPITAAWIERARTYGFDKPINAGGGILSPEDVAVMKDAGADSVFLGSIAMLRGWRVRSAIKAARRIFNEGEDRDERSQTHDAAAR